MDAAQEARCKEMLDQILIMVTKMVSDLEACNAAFRTSPPAFVADSDSSGREVDTTTGTGTGYNSDNSVLATLHSLASASTFESKAAARSLADNDPSADHASSYIVVVDQDSASLTPCIDRFVLATSCSILYSRGLFFTVPSHATSNQVLGRPIGKRIFGDKFPAMAMTRTLELMLTSAKDPKDVNLLSKMEVYAMLSLSGDPLSRKRVQADRTGDRNPIWNAMLCFPATGTGSLHVLLRTERALGDSDISEVHIPIIESSL